jgi:hypothetical protein
LNLPVSSVRDIAIHGDDVIVATHGRSIWILDDITPLRQAALHTPARSAFLYQPGTAVRVDNDPFPGTPIPLDEPTAENPPNGAPLDYFLPAAAARVELRILDADGRVLRRFTSAEDAPPPHLKLPIAEQWFPAPPRLAAGAGMHRYLWSLASATSGDLPDNAPDSGDGDIPRAPRVPPGTYTIELKVDDTPPSRQPLVVTQDPRSPATAAELLRQYELGSTIFRDAEDSRRALAEIAAVQATLETRTQAAAGNAAMLESVAAHRAQLDALTHGAQGLAAASAALASALHAVESSDRETPAQVFAVYDMARAASRIKLAQWAALKAGPLRTLNREFERRGLPALPLAAIERRIDHLATR